MDKAPEKVINDPKPVEATRKGRERYMNKLKESILNDVKNGSGDTTNSSNEATSATSNASNETTSVTNTATTRSNDTCVYEVDIVAVLAIGVGVFFAYNTFQPKIKKQVNDYSAAQHKQKKDQPPKPCPI